MGVGVEDAGAMVRVRDPAPWRGGRLDEIVDTIAADADPVMDNGASAAAEDEDTIVRRSREEGRGCNEEMEEVLSAVDGGGAVIAVVVVVAVVNVVAVVAVTVVIAEETTGKEDSIPVVRTGKERGFGGGGREHGTSGILERIDAM